MKSIYQDMTDAVLPRLALSVHQPMAWAIVHAGRDCENRGPMMLRHLPKPIERRIAIHASKDMTRYEYESGCDFMARLGIPCPPPHELQRGGIIGSVEVTRVSKPSQPPQSRWYCGPRALVLANAVPCDFIPCIGERGYFAWEPADASVVPQPAKWMLPSGTSSKAVEGSSKPPSPQLDLIELVQTQPS